MNNWHRLIWKLDDSTDELNIYESGKPNTFWLEPRVWSGSTVKIGDSRYPPGTLCYAVGFEGSNMKEMWRTVELFPAGTQPVPELEEGDDAPLATVQTIRLEGKIWIDGAVNIVSLFIDATWRKKLHLNVGPLGMYGAGGEDGWGQGTQD